MGLREMRSQPETWRMGVGPPPAAPLLFPQLPSQVFLVRKITRPDSGHLYAMKVLKKATLKGEWRALARELGWSIILMCQGCGFHPWSRRM